MLVRAFVVVVLAGVLAIAAPALAASVTFTFDNTSPLLTGPYPVAASGNTWLTAVFTDNVANTVDLVVTGNFKTYSGKNQGVDHIVFNVDPDSLLSLTTSDKTHIDSVSQSADGEGVPPDKGFDIDIKFGEGSSNLQGTQVAKITFSGTGLTANAFNAPSEPPKAGDPKYYTVVHVQDTPLPGGGFSSSKLANANPIPVPASATIGAALLACVVMCRVVRRRAAYAE
ncbi:MAG: hypothetical protein NTU53_04630 [Planctomycetota bacterium]|nr:hypothetical protein [Planctomycetota bacterium]